MVENLKSRFNQIMEDNQRRIQRICRAYAFNKEDQEDLFQDVALNIWKSLPSFRQEAAIGSWVYRICLNVCMQWALKQNRSGRIFNETAAAKIIDEHSDLQTHLEDAEKTKQLYECISRLDLGERSLILLFLEDLPYKTISEISGISENHVAVKISRIKTKLYNSLNSQ